MIARLFERHPPEGWEVVVTSGDFGTLFSPEAWEGVDAALVDLRLGGVRGLDVLAHLRLHHPRIRRIAMTGWLEDATETMGLVERVLVKPFTAAALADTLR